MSNLLPQVQGKTLYISSRPLTPIRMWLTFKQLRAFYDPPTAITRAETSTMVKSSKGV